MANEYYREFFSSRDRRDEERRIILSKIAHLANLCTDSDELSIVAVRVIDELGTFVGLLDELDNIETEHKLAKMGLFPVEE